MEENKGFKVVTCEKAIARVFELFTNETSSQYMGPLVDHKLGLNDDYFHSSEFIDDGILDKISVIQLSQKYLDNNIKEKG